MFILFQRTAFVIVNSVALQYSAGRTAQGLEVTFWRPHSEQYSRPLIQYSSHNPVGYRDFATGIKSD